ncbi:adenine nucleotide translocase lysine N-methyltransferase [Phoenicopterus ruber ruber]
MSNRAWPCTAAHNRKQLCTALHNCEQLCTAAHNCEQPCAAAHNREQLCTALQNCEQPRTALHNREQLCRATHNGEQPCTAAHNCEQLCMALHNHEQPCTAAHNRQQPCAAVHNRKQPCTALHNRKQPCTAAHNREQLCTALHNREQLGPNPRCPVPGARGRRGAGSGGGRRAAGPPLPAAMEPGEPGEPGEPAWGRRGEALGGRGLLELAVATGVAAWATWAALLMPGFRRVPLRLQVPYQPSGPRQVANALALLRGRSGKTVDLGSGDGRLVVEAYKRGLRPAVGYELNPWLLGLSRYRAWKAGYGGKVSFLREDLWKVNLADCYNVIVFLAPSVKPPLAAKLLAELPDEARVVAGRFPFPSWTPTSTLGQGLEQAWAYDMKEVRRVAQSGAEGSPV